MSLQRLACRCLNITITSTTPSAPVEGAPVQFERIHVGDDGIKVAHSQLLLRRRQSTDCVQWNTVSCLLCRTVVYRVASDVPGELQLRGGLVAPPDDGEGEVLRGRDGFIEVNVGSEGCLDDKAISAATHSDRFSDTFGLLLPVVPKPAPLSGPSTPQRPSSPHSRPMLPTLPPLFHPPPYSPSHPVFVRLSKTATATSARFRAQAEAEIEAFVEAQAAKVLEQERHLRGQVELIWSRWRESWKHETDSSPAEPSVLSTHAGAVVVPVREFSPTAPAAVPVQRPSSSTGPSMLSQSLRQSHFVPPPQSAPAPASPQLPVSANGVRNPLDDSFAISASFQIRTGDALRAHESAKEAEERRRKRLSSRSNPPPPVVPEESIPEEDAHLSRNGVAEGKRKVTFQADVKEEDGGSQPVSRKPDDGEQTGTPILFDIDDEPNPDPSPTDEQQTPSEEPTTPRARAKAKSKARPDPPKIGNKAPVPALLTVNLGPSPSPAKPKSPKSVPESPKTRAAKPGEEKLRELVAANYPSHRDAWKPNGKGWDLFDARRKLADSSDTASIASEESNGSRWHNPSQFATSLPVKIAAGPLADTEREPKSSLPNEAGETVPVFRAGQTPRQTRERTYAMRDLARSMDPGPVLELQAAEDAADETDDDDDEDAELSNAERIRRRTMRIVQRQSGVPDAGMWRSIAS